MRLIDADAFVEKMNGIYDEYFYDVLEEMPSIDAVPVVRCKDCRYFHIFSGDWADCDFHDWYRAEPTENDYCSHGERKNDSDSI